MSLGQILRKRREQLKLTLDEVAALTGFSKPYLSTIETGHVKNPPSDKLLRKLEEYLKFEPGHLQHLAHVERMPVDIRHEYEAIDAENRRFRQIIKDIIAHKINPEKLDKLLNGCDLQADAESPYREKPGQWVPIINKVPAGYPAEFDDMGYPVGFGDDYVRCPDIHDPNAFAVRVVGDSMQPKFAEGDVVIFSPAADIQNGDDCFVRLREPHETTFKRIFFEPDNRIRLQPRNNLYAPVIVESGRVTGLYRAVIHYQKL
ncbi:MAG TPA: XRE family transcriptional regulator [Anaerohalosphaeraceae bacterium]|nr:XRE family transcriptional regulator [Anaerohalosphaeraceae bacterium]